MEGGRRPLGVAENLMGLGEEEAPRLGESHPALRSLEKADLQLLFEAPDLLAEGRLRNVQPVRGAAEVQLVGKDDEVAEMT